MTRGSPGHLKASFFTIQDTATRSNIRA